MTSRTLAWSGALALALAATGCGNDHQHPPFASSTCAVPPCSTPVSRSGGTLNDAGRPADATAEAALVRDR